MLSASYTLGCSQSSTSFSDIIINNINAIADGLISGFGQFVHDPQYLKDTVAIFNKQRIPSRFPDAVVLRRIETQKLDDIWDFPLNMSCPTTTPLPWTICDATVKSKNSTFGYEFNIMRIVDFIGRNYVRIVLPQVDTSKITSPTGTPKFSNKSEIYLGAWHRDLIPRIVDKVSFYPRSNCHKLFEYTGSDIFVHNILFGNNAKRMNDLMSGEDMFELCYDPYRVHGSALGIASYKGIDNVAMYNTNYNPDAEQTFIEVLGIGNDEKRPDGYVDLWQPDTYMTGKQLKTIYSKNLWYETPVIRNYHARHSIHSRRIIHAEKIIMFPLDILPFGYSIASSLPSASLAGDCGYVSIEIKQNWFHNSFYLTKLSDIPLLYPVVNHTHLVPGDYIAGTNYISNIAASGGAGVTNGNRITASCEIDNSGNINATGSMANLVGWVNPLSIGRFGNPAFWNNLSGLNKSARENGNVQNSAFDINVAQTTNGQMVNYGNVSELENALSYYKNLPTSNDNVVPGAWNAETGLIYGVTGSGISVGTSVPAFESSRISANTTDYVSSYVGSDDMLLTNSSIIYDPTNVDSTWANNHNSNISVKLLQVGYQTLPCIRQFLSKLPNIYITTEWSTATIPIDSQNFDIKNDLYIQAILLWFRPNDIFANGGSVLGTRIYPHNLENHEMPLTPGIRLQNENSQGTTVWTYEMMNELTPHLLGLYNPLLENMALIAFTPKLTSNDLPLAYYDCNISGYLKGSFLNADSNFSQGSYINLKSGEVQSISIGVNGVASVNLNLFRLIF